MKKKIKFNASAIPPLKIVLEWFQKHVLRFQMKILVFIDRSMRLNNDVLIEI